VEEERKMGRRTVANERVQPLEELQKARTDVIAGMFFSNS
jgi:hypothetical protein